MDVPRFPRQQVMLGIQTLASRESPRKPTTGFRSLAQRSSQWRNMRALPGCGPAPAVTHTCCTTHFVRTPVNRSLHQQKTFVPHDGKEKEQVNYL